MIQVQEHQIERFQMMPSKRSYLFRAGFKGMEIQLNPSMAATVDQIYLQGLELAEPRLHYIIIPRKEVAEELIPGLYTDSQQMAFWVSTLGSKIDQQIQHYIQQEQILNSSLLDAWGSEALEEVNEAFHQYLQNRYSAGQRRFSPGFGDLPIRVNHQLLDLIRGTPVIANKMTGILSPSKSTTCLIGWK